MAWPDQTTESNGRFEPNILLKLLHWSNESGPQWRLSGIWATAFGMSLLAFGVSTWWVVETADERAMNTRDELQAAIAVAEASREVLAANAAVRSANTAPELTSNEVRNAALGRGIAVLDAWRKARAYRLGLEQHEARLERGRELTAQWLREAEERDRGEAQRSGANQLDPGRDTHQESTTVQALRENLAHDERTLAELRQRTQEARQDEAKAWDALQTEPEALARLRKEPEDAQRQAEARLRQEEAYQRQQKALQSFREKQASLQDSGGAASPKSAEKPGLLANLATMATAFSTLATGFATLLTTWIAVRASGHQVRKLELEVDNLRSELEKKASAQDCELPSTPFRKPIRRRP